MSDATRKKIEEYTQSELFDKIGEVCAAVNISTDTRELLEKTLRLIMALFDAERGSIFILKENRKDLILKVACGMMRSEEEKIVKKMGEGVVGRVAKDKKPIFVDDISNDQRFKNFKARKSYRTPSFICAPLMIKDVLIGVINIADKGSGSRFTKNELQLLDFLTSQIALNYRRVQLYQKFKTIVKESQCLKDELGKTSQETTNLKKQIVLQEKLASVGKLAGGIAHEFNNPLDGVMRYTNLCLEHAKGEAPCDVCRGYMLEIKHGLNRMANIVRSLLACSRNSCPTMEKLDPRMALEQSIQSSQELAAHKSAVVHKDICVNLPEIIDMGFERVATNLIRNAIDSVEQDVGEIFVSCRVDYDQLVLEVRDNGCGVPEDSLETIFEPFYTTKDIEKGCGLGLTIVSEIVKSYEGQINVRSKVDEGTTFSVTIPIKL